MPLALTIFWQGRAGQGVAQEKSVKSVPARRLQAHHETFGSSCEAPPLIIAAIV